MTNGSIAVTPPSALDPKPTAVMSAAQPLVGSVTTAGTAVPLRVMSAAQHLVGSVMTVGTVVPLRVMSVAQRLVASVMTVVTVVPLRAMTAPGVRPEMTAGTVVPLRVMSVAQRLAASVTTADTAVPALGRADDPRARVATHTLAMAPPAPAPAAQLTAPTGGQKQSRVVPSAPRVRTTAALAPVTAMTAPREPSTVTLGRLVMRARPVMTAPHGRSIAMRALRARLTAMTVPRVRSIVTRALRARLTAMRAQRDRSIDQIVQIVQIAQIAQFDQIAHRERLTAMAVMGALTATSDPCAVSRASTRAVTPRRARLTTLCLIASRPMPCRLPMLRA